MSHKPGILIGSAVALAIGAMLMFSLTGDQKPVAGETKANASHDRSSEIAPSQPSALIPGVQQLIEEQNISPKEWFAKALMLRKQEDQFSKSEANEMLWFIENVREVDGIPELMLAEVKNDLMNRLGAEASPELFGGMLMRMQADKGQLDVMRDYAVQYLSQFYDKMPDQELVQKAFWERINDTQGTTGPTALIALNTLSQKDKLTEKARLNQRVREIASQKTARDSARLTALNILGAINDVEVLNAAKTVLEEDKSVALTLVALNAVASFGSEKDGEWLKLSPLNKRPELRKGIEKTLKLLSQKHEL